MPPAPRATRVAVALVSESTLHEAPVENPGAPALDLVRRLCGELASEGIHYCHWKSNESLDRSAAGDNDLDLLISRTHAQAFSEILRRSGFKSALLPQGKELPGVFHAYALDEGSGKLVHVHAHYQLVLGDDMTKNYRVPIEEAYLASAVQGPVFRVPSPEFELGVFLIRMVLKHLSWDAILSLQGRLSASERRELADLTGQVDFEHVRALMREHLPFVEPALWQRCLQAVQPGSSPWLRVTTAHRLQRDLSSHARRPLARDTALKLGRRGLAFVRRHVLRSRVQKGLDSGGALIAIVGGDGAGKSTVVECLHRFLGRDFETHRVHLGKPPRSLLSRVSQSAWDLGRKARPGVVSGKTVLMAVAARRESLGLRAIARLAWEVMTARDRCREYVRARRLASNGALVVCDRYPLAQIRQMDGPAASGLVEHPQRLVRALARLEKRYYDRMLGPEILIVLRVHPDVAVRRKAGVDREEFVRPRSEEIWRTDWRGTPAIVVDAGRPADAVLAQVKSTVWSRL